MIEMSTETAELFAALSAFTGDVTAPKKTSTNPHFKSKFADLSEVIETAKGPLAKHGLSLVQLPCGECDGAVRVVTMVTHKSGQWIRSTLEMPVAQKNPQAVGSAITYARRYAAMSVLGMAADDDDGEQATRGKDATKPARPKSLDDIAPPVSAEATVTAYNMAAKAAHEISNVPFTGECDEFGLMIPPGSVPVFGSGADAGKAYDKVPAGKLRALMNSEKFRDAAAPQTQIYTAYLVARHEAGKLKENGNVTSAA